MSQQKVESMLKPKVIPTLGLLGATVNAMALIAPGAFLWITYQLQAAATVPSGASCASDMERDYCRPGGLFPDRLVLCSIGEDLSGSRFCQLRLLRGKGLHRHIG